MDPVRRAMFDTVAVANAKAVMQKKSTVRQKDLDTQMKRMGDGGMDGDEPDEPAEAARREAVVSDALELSQCLLADITPIYVHVCVYATVGPV